MTHFDVEKRTIYLTKHGSHAYGLNTPTSDEDVKGICIKPKECYFSNLKKFEQHEHMGSKTDGIDKVIYSLDKFVHLASDCNPNIIEVLFSSSDDVLFCDEFGQRLLEYRDNLLSKKAKFTFSGYAHAQLKRIKTHRAWLLNPPTKAPERTDYGLPDAMKISQSELGAFESQVNSGLQIEVPKDIVTLFVKERQYLSAKMHYDQYINWTKTRNPVRAELEKKYGYDVKHGMHLIRLMTMAVEILKYHKVIVKRVEDRDYLMKVRSGGVSYDELIDRAGALESEADALYTTSTLRKDPDRVAIDQFLVKLTEDYLSKYG